MRAIPPPLWMVILIAGAYALSLAPGLRDLPSIENKPAGLIVGGIALLIVLVAMLQFRLANTQLLPNSATNNRLVVAGVFHFTRNPMYLGMVLFSLGAALWFGRLPMLLAPALMFAIANWAFIPFEEAKMRRQFSAEFDAYTKRVRRWI